MTPNLQSILKLSIPERLLLVEEIWNSIAFENPALKLSSAQKQFLDIELEEYRKNPDDGITWEEMKKKLKWNKKR